MNPVDLLCVQLVQLVNLQLTNCVVNNQNIYLCDYNIYKSNHQKEGTNTCVFCERCTNYDKLKKIEFY